MSIWADIHKRSNGSAVRKEDLDKVERERLKKVAQDMLDKANKMAMREKRKIHNMCLALSVSLVMLWLIALAIVLFTPYMKLGGFMGGINFFLTPLIVYIVTKIYNEI